MIARSLQKTQRIFVYDNMQNILRIFRDRERESVLFYLLYIRVQRRVHNTTTEIRPKTFRLRTTLTSFRSHNITHPSKTTFINT